MQTGMPQANALKSIGYTDTVLFLTIGKPDIYQHKSLCKSATVFYLCDQKLPKLAAELPILFCDKFPAYRRRRSMSVLTITIYICWYELFQYCRKQLAKK